VYWEVNGKGDPEGSPQTVGDIKTPPQSFEGEFGSDRATFFIL